MAAMGQFKIASLKHNLMDIWTRTTRMPAFWDTPRGAVITHTSDSHQIPSQNTTKSKLQNLKNAKTSNFEILQETLHVTHLLKLLDKLYKYEMVPTRTVGATERTQDAGWSDGRTKGRTDGVKPIYPSTTSLWGGIMIQIRKNVFRRQFYKCTQWTIRLYITSRN